jgi:hypothetical protein
MDEYDIMNKALMEYENARRLKRINQELYDHLSGSIYYLLKYSEKYSLTLPKKDELIRLIETSHFYTDQFAKPNQHPKLNTEKNNDKTHDLEAELHF